MSASRSSIDFSRSRRCSRRKAARSESSAHSASASGLTGPMRSRRRERRSTRSLQLRLLGLVGRRREPRLVELLAHLVEAGGELGAPVFEAGERHLDLRAALAGALELAAQLRLLIGEPAQLAALEAGALVVADVELGDEARGVRPQGAGARLDRGAGGAHVGELREAPVELLEALAVRRGAAAGGLRRSAARSAAARRSSSSTRRRVTSASDAECAPSAWRSAASASSAAGRSCSVCDQRVRRRGVGCLLAGGGLRELGGDPLDGAPVALQVFLQVAAAGAHLAQVALGGLGGRCALRARRRPRPRRPRAPRRAGRPPASPRPLRAASRAATASSFSPRRSSDARRSSSSAAGTPLARPIWPSAGR